MSQIGSNPLRKPLPKKRDRNPANRPRGKWNKFRKQYIADKIKWGNYLECEWRGSRPDLVYEPSNLRLLCRNFHVKRHK